VKFLPTLLQDAFVIELEKRADDRGFFARCFCEREFHEAGLETRFVQINNSLSVKAGTLRGLHYQLAPAAEVKLVRCVSGALFDVIVDIRPSSPTFGLWFGEELSSENRRMMYVPRGFAHAVLTLRDDTEVLYMVSASYSPENERGLRWNDPRFSIQWPCEPTEISGKDASWPHFDPTFHGVERLRGLK
jgi:dTDP-4-dehydrorhamnose 3,5-epimerase